MLVWTLINIYSRLLCTMSDSECSEVASHSQIAPKEKQTKHSKHKKQKEVVQLDPSEDEEEYNEEAYEGNESDEYEEDSYENEMFQDNNSSCSIDAFEFFSRFLENDQEESVIDVLTGIRDNGNDTRNAILKVAKELHNLNGNLSTIISGMTVDEEEYAEPRQRRSKKTR